MLNMAKKKGFNKLHLIWIIPLFLLVLIIIISVVSSRLTSEQKAFKVGCESSGGTFTLCTGNQGGGFLGMLRGSCEPAGRLKCFCPPMQGLEEQNGVCI